MATLLAMAGLAGGLPGCGSSGDGGSQGAQGAVDACRSKLESCGLGVSADCSVACLAPCMAAASCSDLEDGSYSVAACAGPCGFGTTSPGTSSGGEPTGTGGASGTGTGPSTTTSGSSSGSSGGGDCEAEGAWCDSDAECCGGHCYSYTCTSQCLGAQASCYLVGTECCAGLTCVASSPGSYDGTCQ
jgi:hypothetical protein